jgi:choline-glycine betaine transporter
VLVLGLSFARSHVASSLPPGASAAAVSVIDTVTEGLRQLVRVVVVVALAVVLVALVVGPSRGARRVRSLAVAGWNGARGGMDRAAGTPLAIPVAIGVAVVCVLVVVFAGDLGTGWTIVLAAVAALALVVALLAGRAPAPEVREPAAGA